MGGEGSGKKKKAVVKKAKEPKVPVVDGKKGKNPRRTRKHLADPAAGAAEYHCEDILAESFFEGVRHWLVRWKGYSEKDDTWEPLGNLAGCEELRGVERS